MPIESSQSNFVDLLIATGIVPKECTYIDLSLRPNEPIRMKMECFVTVEQLSEITTALVENFKARSHSKTATVDLPGED